MPDSPISPISELAAAALGAHELFLAYQAAGFTEDQSMRLVAATVTAAMRGGNA